MRTGFVLSLLVLSLVAPAQLSNDARQKRSTEILVKARQVDLLYQIMPLLLTKKQINDLLPVLDKCRQEVKRVEMQEYDFLVKLEPQLDAAIKDAIKNDRSPKREALADSYATFRLFQMRRNATSAENINRVMEVLDKTLNKGQLKAMAETLRPSLIDPTIDPKKMTEEQRKRFFVSVVLLDPSAFEVLSKLAAK